MMSVVNIIVVTTNSVTTFAFGITPFSLGFSFVHFTSEALHTISPMTFLTSDLHLDIIFL